MGNCQNFINHGDNKMSYVEGESIGEVYIKALKAIVTGVVPHWYLTVHISKPVLKINPTIPSLEIKDWLQNINVEDKVLQEFVKFQFSKPDLCTGGKGKTGEDWINERIKDLLHLDGYCNKALRCGYSFDQLAEVEKRLSTRNRKRGRIHGGGTNALVCQVFLPDRDLKAACRPRPSVSGVRCLTHNP